MYRVWNISCPCLWFRHWQEIWGMRQFLGYIKEHAHRWGIISTYFSSRIAWRRNRVMDHGLILRDVLLSVQNNAICMGCAMPKIPRLKWPPVLTWLSYATFRLKFRWKESFSPLQRWRCWSPNEASWLACKCSALSSAHTERLHFQTRC